MFLFFSQMYQKVVQKIFLQQQTLDCWTVDTSRVGSMDGSRQRFSNVCGSDPTGVSTVYFCLMSVVGHLWRFNLLWCFSAHNNCPEWLYDDSTTLIPALKGTFYAKITFIVISRQTNGCAFPIKNNAKKSLSLRHFVTSYKEGSSPDMVPALLSHTVLWWHMAQQ